MKWGELLDVQIIDDYSRVINYTEPKLVKLVDLSEDSINEIAEAVAQKLMSRGHWVREPNCWYRCSKCGSHYPSLADNMDYHYCPNCGTKMDGMKI